MPEDSSEPYDMRQVISSVFDRGSFLEVHANYAQNALVGFARLDGFPVGVVANQPMYLAGVLDIDSSDKIARFVRFCDAFNLPDHHLRRLPRLPARRRRRSTAGSSATAPRSSTPTARRPCPRSASWCARPWAAPTSP